MSFSRLRDRLRALVVAFASSNEMERLFIRVLPYV